MEKTFKIIHDYTKISDEIRKNDTKCKNFHKKEYYNVPLNLFGYYKTEQFYQVECTYTKKIGHSPVLISEKWVGEKIVEPCEVGIKNYFNDILMD